MSCTMMKIESLAALANAIEARLNCGFNFWGFDTPESLISAARDCRVAGSYCAEEIYQRLYALNAKAYNSRYKEGQHTQGEDAPVIDGSRYIVHHPALYLERRYAVCAWHYQLAQLLDFWLYQTDENGIRDDPLRLGIMEFRDALFAFIVRNASEYSALPWGDLPCGEEDGANRCDKSVPLPVRVETEDDRVYIDYICPCCESIISQQRKGQTVGLYRPNYHADCGQRLKWPDDTERMKER